VSSFIVEPGAKLLSGLCEKSVAPSPERCDDDADGAIWKIGLAQVGLDRSGQLGGESRQGRRGKRS
jgi:hypothetical protein